MSKIFKFFIKKLKFSKSGFTLLDVLFAVAIAVIGLVTVLALLRYVTLAGRLSADRFSATNLAEEGIEIVRSIRDSNWLAANPWSQGLASGRYRAQYDSTSLTSCGASCLPLRINTTTGFYGYIITDPLTKFTRTIIIGACNPPSADCLDVTSQVSWQLFGRNYSVTIEDWLYNWYR